MSKVLLVVTFRSHQQLPGHADDAKTTVKALIDPVNAGKLEQDLPSHPECFTFSLPCEIDFSHATGPVGLNLVNNQVAILIRHISNAIPDAVIIASAGSLMDSEVKEEAPVVRLIHFQTALSLLGEIASILAVDSLENVAAPALTDCMRRINAFLNEHDKDRSAQESTGDGNVS